MTAGHIARSAALGVAASGFATLGYAGLIERNAFTLRHFDVPVLAAGAAPIRVLHLSDLHLVPRQQRKIEWVRGLVDLRPDLVIATGDFMSSLDAPDTVLHALAPLFELPGAFVPGNNDYWAPVFRSPLRYFQPKHEVVHGLPLPWSALAQSMSDAGWLDLTHARTLVTVAGREVFLAGTDDPHLRRARYELIAGPADPSAAVRIGAIHSPEPVLLQRFAEDRYDLVLAGHTHGGQVRVPFGPAIVTNCSIDVHRARWLHPWDEHMYFHVCAGLGTNPFSAVRLGCRPEASLLTLVPRSGRR